MALMINKFGTVVDTSYSGHAHCKGQNMHEDRRPRDRYNYEDPYGTDEHHNSHLGRNVDEVENALTKHYEYPDEDKIIDDYTSDSSRLNNYNMDRHKTRYFEDQRTVSLEHEIQNKNLDRMLHSRRTPTYLDVFHGAAFNPGEEASKHPENRLFMPAYTSTSISKKVAKGFGNPQDDGYKHLIQFHLSPGNPGGYIGHHSNFPDEREFLLPKDVSWRIHHTPDEHEEDGNKIKVWHAYDMQHHPNELDPKIKKMLDHYEQNPLEAGIAARDHRLITKDLIHHDANDIGIDPQHIRDIHSHGLFYDINNSSGHAGQVILDHPATTRQHINDLISKYNPSNSSIWNVMPLLNHKKFTPEDMEKHGKEIYEKLKKDPFILAQSTKYPMIAKNITPKDAINISKSELSHTAQALLHSALTHHGHDAMLNELKKHENVGHHALDYMTAKLLGSLAQHKNEILAKHKPEEFKDPKMQTLMHNYKKEMTESRLDRLKRILS